MAISKRFDYTGGMLESDVFGETTFDKYEVMERRKRGEYDPYRKALQLVKSMENQKPGFDPTLPERPFPADLRDSIARALGIDPESAALTFYTAVNSSLDVMHGVDAFFEYTDPYGTTRQLTLDCTGDPEKKQGKANIILQFPKGPIEDLDKKQVRDTLDQLTVAAVHILTGKTPQESTHFRFQE